MQLSTTVNPFIFPNDGSMTPYFEDLRRYSKLGYDSFDLILCSAADPACPLMNENWEKWVEAYAEEADRLGVKFGQSHVPFYNFADQNKGQDPIKDKAIIRSIMAAARLGAKWTVVHPSTLTNTAFWTRESRERNIMYFTPLVELAEKHNIGIALENMADFKIPGLKRHYAALVEELCDLADAFGSSFIGVCWDFGHANMIYSDQNDCLRYIGKRLKATHVHDNDGTWDAHLPPFFGSICWEPLMKTLKEMEYQGSFSFEIRRLPPHLPEDVKSSLWEFSKKLGDYLLNIK